MYRQRVGQERLVTIDVTGKDGQHAVYVLQKAGPTWKVVLLDWSVRRLGAAAQRWRVALPGISQGGIVIVSFEYLNAVSGMFVC